MRFRPLISRHLHSHGAKLKNQFAKSGRTWAVLANTSWLLLDKLTRIVLAIVVGAWVARHLGPANYGELAYVLALVALIQAACTLGLDGPVVRDIAEDKQHAAAVLGSAFRMRLTAGMVGWLVAVLSTIALRPGDQAAVLMVAIVGATLVFQPAEVVDLWLQSQSKSRISIVFRLVAYCTVASGKVVLILINAPLWAFAVAALADAVLIAVALAWAYTKQPSPNAWTWNGSIAKKLLFESWPLMLAAISVGIYMRIDQIMLRNLTDERQLGLFSAVMPFSQAWHMVPMTLCASLLPSLAQLQQQNPDRYRARLQQVYNLMAWSGAAVAGLTALCAPWLVNTLLGPRFAEAVPVLQWHAITNIFVFLGVAQSLTVINERTPRVFLYKTLFGALVSVVGNLILIPKWGAVGAAWSAVFAYFSAAVLSNLFFAPRALRMQLRVLIPFS